MFFIAGRPGSQFAQDLFDFYVMGKAKFWDRYTQREFFGQSWIVDTKFD